MLAIALGLFAVSCGGGDWVDTEVGDCDELKNDKDARAAAEEWAFPQMCEGLGKTYAGKWQCPNGTVEISCK